MKCPGQDRGYWSGDCVSEMPCPKCGHPVEFFKDEQSRACARCGHRFSNPRVTLDCASWCDQAEACLGFSRARGRESGEGDRALSNRLMQALEQEFQDDPSRFARILLVFQHAKELASLAGANPALVLPAALLSELEDAPDSAPSSPSHAAGDLSRTRELLTRTQVDPDLTAGIVGLLKSLCNHEEDDCVEGRVVRDSLALAAMTTAERPTDPPGLDRLIESRFRTEAGKSRARQLFLP